MSQFYLYLFVSICIGLLFWGLVRAERVYQFPFFMGAIFVTFLLPQAFALYDNPDSVEATALSRVFFMCCLCAVMCWAGYQINPNHHWVSKLNIVVEDYKLFRIGIIFLIISYIFKILLGLTAIETASNGNWTGPATVYVFFGKMIYIALAIFLIELLKRPSIKNFIFASLAAVIPFLTILAGRRQPTMTFVLIIGLSFWFARKYVPPKIIVVLMVILALYLMPLLGKLRGNTWKLVAEGDWQQLSSTSQESLEIVLEGEILELRNAALIMDASTKTGDYGYGTGLWDGFVFQYVPGQLIGRDLKKSLQFNWGPQQGHLLTLYGYSIPQGSTHTGIADSFREFDYFGCLLFALIGMIFKTLWVSATYYRSQLSMLLYIGLMSPAMLSVTHSIKRFLVEAIFQVFFVGVAMYYSRQKTATCFEPRKSTKLLN